MIISKAAEILRYTYGINKAAYLAGKERFSVNLIGPAGIGKTAVAKQALGEEVRVCKVNPAQWVDSGDVSGTPEKFFYVYTDSTKTKVKLISEKLASTYAPKPQIFYEVMNGDKVEMIPQTNIKNIDSKDFVRKEGRIQPITVFTEDLFVYDNDKQLCETHYATPFWWPKNKDEKVALILDDSWRSSGPVQQALMELVYEYKFNGNPLPENVMVIVTNNPDDGEYTVQSIDPAQRRRTINIKVEFSMKDYMEHEMLTMNEHLYMFLSMNPDAMKRTEGSGKDAVVFTEMAANVSRFSQFIGDGDPKTSEVRHFFNACGPMFFGDDSQFVSQFDTFLNGKQHMLPSSEDFFNWPIEKLEKQLEPVKDKLGLMGICIRRVINHIQTTDNFESLIPRLKLFLTGDLFMEDKKTLLVRPIVDKGGLKYLNDPNFRELGRYINLSRDLGKYIQH